MISLTPEEVSNIIDKAVQEMSDGARGMLEELWGAWSHLGIEDDRKIMWTRTIIDSDKKHHNTIVLGVKNKIDMLRDQINKLKADIRKTSETLPEAAVALRSIAADQMMFKVKNELEELHAQYKEQMQQQLQKLERLVEWQRTLANQLGDTTVLFPKERPVPSEEELAKMTERLTELQAERDSRVQTIMGVRDEMKNIMFQLEILPRTSMETVIVTSSSALPADFRTSNEDMERLAMLQKELQEKYEEKHKIVMEMRKYLQDLWKRIQKDVQYCQGFVQALPTSPLSRTEAALKEEITTCELISQVLVTRANISVMWDEVLMSKEERSQCTVYHQEDLFNEDTLAQHEVYLNDLNKFFEENKEIFELVAIRKKMWQKMAELEARVSDPSRHRNRGGQLLREEKERVEINRKLKKYEEKLRELATAYNESTGRIFTVYGKPLMTLIADEWQAKKAERHDRVLSARQQVSTPTMTPLERSKTTLSLGKLGMITPNQTTTTAPPSYSLCRRRRRTSGSGMSCPGSNEKNRRKSGIAAARAVAKGSAHLSKINFKDDTDSD